jgi:hypothetical protein
VKSKDKNKSKSSKLNKIMQTKKTLNVKPLLNHQKNKIEIKKFLSPKHVGKKLHLPMLHPQ